jgi:hypothetical protein
MYVCIRLHEDATNVTTLLSRSADECKISSKLIVLTGDLTFEKRVKSREPESINV